MIRELRCPGCNQDWLVLPREERCTCQPCRVCGVWTPLAEWIPRPEIDWWPHAQAEACPRCGEVHKMPVLVSRTG